MPKQMPSHSPTRAVTAALRSREVKSASDGTLGGRISGMLDSRQTLRPTGARGALRSRDGGFRSVAHTGGVLVRALSSLAPARRRLVLGAVALGLLVVAAVVVAAVAR